MKFLSRGWKALIAAAIAACLLSCGGGNSPPRDEAPFALKAEPLAFAGNGYYWNPAEPGTGLFFEAQGGVGVLTVYAYDEAGRPVWYTASGAFQDGGGSALVFTGTLQRYSGGQSARMAVARTPSSTAAGDVKVTFDGGKAKVVLPGRSFDAERLFGPGSGTPATPTQPETGVYWNPGESGRGYTIETRNGVATIGVFHYDDAGNPMWHLVVSPIAADGKLSGDFLTYVGGQTLAGPWKAATPVQPAGKFGGSFQTACQGTIAFPGMGEVAVRRFAFGSLASGRECRAAGGALAPANPAYLPGLSLSLASPKSLQGIPLVGGAVDGVFSFLPKGDLTLLEGKTLYLLVEDPEQFYSGPGTVRFDAASRLFYLTLKSNALSRIGPYKGQLRLFACLNAACTEQLQGSPFSVPYDVTVREGPKVAPWPVHTVYFKPGEDVLTTTFTVTVPAYTTRFRMSGFPFLWNVPGLNHDQFGEINLDPQPAPRELQVRGQVTKWSIGDSYKVEIETVTSTHPPDSLFQRTQQTSRLSLEVALRSQAETAANPTPLAPLPGVPAWSIPRGNPAHTGYVAAAVEPARFSRRFGQSQIGSGPVVTDGVRACLLRRDQHYAQLQCHSEQTGQLLWQLDNSQAGLIRPTATALAGGRLLVADEDGEAAWLRVFDAATGLQLPGHRIPGFIIASLSTVAGDQAYLVGTFPGGGARVVNLASGQVTPIAGLPVSGVGTLAVADGKLVASTFQSLIEIADLAGTHRVTAAGNVTLNAASLAVTSAAAYAVGLEGGSGYSLVAYNRTVGSVDWMAQGKFRSYPVPAGDSVYILNDEFLAAYAATTGTLRWSVRIPGFWSGGSGSSPLPLVVVGKHAFLRGPNGTHAVDLDTQQIAWTYPLGGALAVSPNGVLYISGDREFAAINLR